MVGVYGSRVLNEVQMEEEYYQHQYVLQLESTKEILVCRPTGSSYQLPPYQYSAPRSN